MTDKPKPYTEISESELVRMARQRDQEAFEELMRRNAPTSLRLAVSILKDRQEAEDQVQTSFFNAWKRLGQFQFDSRFSTWFRTIVVNQSLMRLRAVRRASVQSLDDRGDSDRPREYGGGEPSPEAELGRKEITSQLRKEVQRLPPILRDVLILRDLEELPTEVVAERLGITVSSAKSRLLRARQMLKERMERHAGQTSLFAM